MKSFLAATHFRKFLGTAMLALLSVFPTALNAADSASELSVQFDVGRAGPRAIESLTERAIVRDYRSAWMSLAEAVESNNGDLLETPFAGDAKRVLHETVISQQRSGLHQRYLNQSHKLEAVFYAPEGDVMELHDTAEYEQQVFDGSKSIQDQRVVVHYVVLMTPSSDRWVVRQLQVVPQF